MKAVLILNEMPTECIECPFHRIYADYLLMATHCVLTGEVNLKGTNTRAEWCPLKSLPSFKAVDLNDTRDVVMFCHGWNTCLAEITGDADADS